MRLRQLSGRVQGSGAKECRVQGVGFWVQTMLRALSD